MGGGVGFWAVTKYMGWPAAMVPRRIVSPPDTSFSKMLISAGACPVTDKTTFSGFREKAESHAGLFSSVAGWITHILLPGAR